MSRISINKKCWKTISEYAETQNGNHNIAIKVHSLLLVKNKSWTLCNYDVDIKTVVSGAKEFLPNTLETQYFRNAYIQRKEIYPIQIINDNYISAANEMRFKKLL